MIVQFFVKTNDSVNYDQTPYRIGRDLPSSNDILAWADP